MNLKPDPKTDRNNAESLSTAPPAAIRLRHNVALDCGWGRLIFGQTFANARVLARTLEQEEEGRRDVAFYVKEPHVVLARAPLTLFLDPSHTFRLLLEASTTPLEIDL